MPPTTRSAPFWAVLERLAHRGVLAEAGCAVTRTQSAGLGEPRRLCALDGTKYFHSTQIHCAQCTVWQREGVTHYAHNVLIPALVRPEWAEVVVLEPEFIVPQDGAEKQDCERKAARRWIERKAARLAGHHTTILADDLHCNQPFCELLLRQRLDFILVCKPDSHPSVCEVERLARAPGGVAQVEGRVWAGRVHEQWVYRYAPQAPLTAQPHALTMNWRDLTITSDTVRSDTVRSDTVRSDTVRSDTVRSDTVRSDAVRSDAVRSDAVRVEETGRVAYHNAWATNLGLSERTVRSIVAAGRARWKIEHESNNVLKNQGCHLEHNFGHGKQHVSTLLVQLMLLASLTHTVLRLCDLAYQDLQAQLGSRQTFFNDFRALTRYIFFPRWDDLLHFMRTHLEPVSKPAPDD